MINLLLTIISFVLIVLITKIIIFSLFFRDDIKAALERDPAATNSLTIILTYPGLTAIFYYRVSHFFYKLKLCFFARVLSQIGRSVTGIEIHPGATIGKGLFIDHGMGVVVGETTIIGNNVTLFQGVTLGGTGKQKGKRHPTLGNNVVVGTGAKVLGNIYIGNNVSVGANAVVLRNVPPNSTVVGVPGRVTRMDGRRVSGVNLDHSNLPDPLTKSLQKLQHEIFKIEKDIKSFNSSKRAESPSGESSKG